MGEGALTFFGDHWPGCDINPLSEREYSTLRHYTQGGAKRGEWPFKYAHQVSRLAADVRTRGAQFAIDGIIPVSIGLDSERRNFGVLDQDKFGLDMGLVQELIDCGGMQLPVKDDFSSMFEFFGGISKRLGIVGFVSDTSHIKQLVQDLTDADQHVSFIALGGLHIKDLKGKWKSNVPIFTNAILD